MNVEGSYESFYYLAVDDSNVLLTRPRLIDRLLPLLYS